MAATDVEILCVFEWLQATHQVTVNGDWLEACISFLKETNRSNLSLLKSQVYEQWLMSSLNESGTGCLPADITNTAKATVHGTLSLQMNSIVNVGESAYSQLKKLKDQDIATIEPSQNKFKEPPPSRMLMMKLTDGEQVVEAMEYKPIKTLHTNLPPGVKVLIKGGPVCRKGILLLKENNISILGGQMESLQQQNSQLHILSRLVGETNPIENAGMTDQQISTTQQRPQLGNNTRDTNILRPSNGVGHSINSQAVVQDDQGFQYWDEDKEDLGIMQEDFSEFLDDDVLADINLDVIDNQTIENDVFDQMGGLDDDDDLLQHLMD